MSRRHDEVEDIDEQELVAAMQDGESQAVPDVEQEFEEILANSSNLQKKFDATQLYLTEIGFSPLLTAEEEVTFARLARKGDQQARCRMIESNLR
jgi:RNA polymerase nonessential primary-like sigma factor